MLHFAAVFAVALVFCSASARSPPRTSTLRPPPFSCREAVFGVCAAPLQEEFEGLGLEEVREKIAATHLRELCRLIIPIPRCIRSTLDELCSEEDKQEVMQHHGNDLTAYGNAIDNVCVQNVNVFEEHKECLMRVALYGEIEDQCRQFEGPCPTVALVDCGVGVIRRQCGAEIAQHVRTVMVKMVEDINCQMGFQKYKRGGHAFMKKAIGLFY